MFQRISVGQAGQILAERQPLILDMRDHFAFDNGHIAGAVHLTDQTLRTALKQTPRDRPVLVYCYHGNSSQDIAKLFTEFGFAEVYSLDGGYEAWRNLAQAPLAVVQGKPANDPGERLRQWLQSHGFDQVDLDAPARLGAAPLLAACRAGDASVVEALLEAGAPVDAVDDFGNDALWAACYSGSLETIQTLLDAGVKINRQNPDGSTALIYAASAGKTEVVEFLLSAGADPAIRNRDDFTALELSANREILLLLRKTAASQAA